MSFSSALFRVACHTAIIVLGLSVGACSSFSLFDEKEKTVVMKDEPADKLYNEGIAALNDRKYTEAGEKFEELNRQHPYTEFARKSTLMMAYAKYSAGEYDDAAQAARRYQVMNPSSKDAPYAQYLIAMSYYNEIPDVTRDQQRTERAMAALQELVTKWPDSEYAEEARKRLVIARDQLAGKEMEIGRFYLTQRNYIGAVNRFKIVITTYQTTRHVEEALARVAEAYMALGVVNEAQTAASILGHNYPDSKWYLDTHKLLTTNGLEPRENSGSWISKAFSKVGLGKGA
jgi:outer membrane protein assembly factor BamD